MKYKKDYSTKNYREWLSEKKWTAFLLTVPTGRPIPFKADNANDINSIKTTASMLNGSCDCPRAFSVTADFDAGVFSVTAQDKSPQ